MRAALLLLTIAPALVLGGLSCMDDNGSPVDWFASIKYSDGTSYSYSDANAEAFVKSANSLASTTDGAVANTLTPAFSESFGLYNDEPPSGDASSKYGHTKGVFALDDSLSGFWLLHSVPKFPTRTGSSYDGYPTSGEVYGQSFLCVSLSGAESFNKVASSLLLTRPAIYDSSLSSTVSSALPNLANVVAGASYLPAASNVTQFTSAGGKDFTYYAKNAAWGQDVYGDLVGSTIGADMWCQTWQNGAGPLPNFCKPTHKYNTLNIQSYAVNGVTIDNTKDHSKWAAIINKSDVCIGGINRMTTQEARGGGTMCFSSSDINSALTGNTVTYSTPPKGACG